MDACRLLKIVCFLSIVLLELVLGAPKCSGKWAIHSCGGGNGKRNEFDFPDEETGAEDRALPGFASQELSVIDGRNLRAEEVNDESNRNMEDSLGGMSSREELRDSEDERYERAWRLLVRRLLKEKMAEYEG